MELQYVKAMEEYGLRESQLTEDAKVGIATIKQSLKGVKLNEARGISISPKTIQKIKANDKWVYYEILDMVNDTDKNEDEMPYEEEEILDDLEVDDEDENEQPNEEEEEEEREVFQGRKTEQEGDSSTGIVIEQDFKAMWDADKKVVKLDQLKSLSKNAYNTIFDNYDESGDNGIETSHFTLIETDEYEFTLTKK
jgi:hypothetical protein